jgi:hypothetical protein
LKPSALADVPLVNEGFPMAQIAPRDLLNYVGKDIRATKAEGELVGTLLHSQSVTTVPSLAARGWAIKAENVVSLIVPSDGWTFYEA